MTPMFRAEDGSVLFRGNPISTDEAKVARDILRAAALDLSATEATANAFWNLAEELRKATSEAVEQSSKVIQFRPRPTENPPQDAA